MFLPSPSHFFLGGYTDSSPCLTPVVSSCLLTLWHACWGSCREGLTSLNGLVRLFLHVGLVSQLCLATFPATGLMVNSLAVVIWNLRILWLNYQPEVLKLWNKFWSFGSFFFFYAYKIALLNESGTRSYISSWNEPQVYFSVLLKAYLMSHVWSIPPSW